MAEYDLGSITIPENLVKGNEWRRRKAAVKVIVSGQDVTSKLDPYLISVVVVDKKDYEVDTATIELDDRDARLELPRIGDPVSVHMGWVETGTQLVFYGFIEEVESGFARRGGGRRLWVDAIGLDVFGLLKQVDRAHLGVGDPPDSQQGGGTQIPFASFAQKVGAMAGANVQVDAIIGGITRNYWSMGGESPMHYFQRIAKELGGVVKFTADGVFIMSKLANIGGSVRAEWGKNLIAWRIKPMIGRPEYAGAGADWFNIVQSMWGNVQQKMQAGAPFGTAIANAFTPQPAPNAQVGEQLGGGQSAESITGRGAGWCMINGEPKARAGGVVMIVGARPGVDGTYGIKEAEHHYNRASGYVTRLNVEDPPSSGSGRNSGQLPIPEPAPNAK